MFCLSFPSYLPKLRISSCFNLSSLSCRFPAFSHRISKFACLPKYAFPFASICCYCRVAFLLSHRISQSISLWCRIVDFFHRYFKIVLTFFGRTESSRYPSRGWKTNHANISRASIGSRQNAMHRVASGHEMPCAVSTFPSPVGTSDQVHHDGGSATTRVIRGG